MYILFYIPVYCIGLVRIALNIFFNFRLKQRQKEKQPEVNLNSSNKSVISPSTVKPSTIYNALVPYYDSDKDDDSDTESSSLYGENNTKHSSDQKVPDKKFLTRSDSSEEVTPKKCLVLKPQNDDSPSFVEQEKEIILSSKKCLVLKPKDEEEHSEVETEPEPHKKCLVRIPKDDCEINNSKLSHSIEEKDSDKKNRRRENGISESDYKSKVRFDHCNYNGLVVLLLISNMLSYFTVNYDVLHTFMSWVYFVRASKRQNYLFFTLSGAFYFCVIYAM